MPKSNLLKRMFKIDRVADRNLNIIARRTGSLSRSAEIRRLIREEAERHGIVDNCPKTEADDGWDGREHAEF